jgi:hypothetical protein
MEMWINLTPHPIRVFKPDGSVEEISPSGQVARVREVRKKAGEVGGLPVFAVEYGEIEGLPSPQPGTYYLVSRPVLDALRSRGVQRPDVFAPDTGAGAIRNERGEVIGVKSLLSPISWEVIG